MSGPPLLVDTPHGPARVGVKRPPGARGALVLGHGAGGGVDAPDLQAVRRAVLARGLAVALVEQPYRVAGRRAPAPAHQLDAAWCAVCARLRQHALEGLPLVTGGRSSGARVACRTAGATGAVAVVCLAFPLRPPQRRADGAPRPSRAHELRVGRVPVLVVQGRADPFGMPRAAAGRTVVRVAGDHALRADTTAVAEAVSRFLDQVLPAAAGRSAPCPRATAHGRAARRA